MNSPRHSRVACALTAIVCIGGCTTQPPYETPRVDVQTAWANATATASSTLAGSPQDEWWTHLHDPAIDTLIASALIDNPTLAQAAARIDEARATLRSSRAQRFPQLIGNGALTRGSSQNQSGGNAATITSSTITTDSASLGASLGWELDLWGRARAIEAAARSRLDARNADAEEARLSLAAQLADSVLSLRACNHSLAIRDEDIASRETELSLMRQRLAVGNVAPVDEANALSNLASARTNRLSQQESCSILVDALVALSGRHAGTVRHLVAQPLSSRESPPAPAAPVAPASQVEAATVMPSAPLTQPDLPATVLLEHPTVRSAERELAASYSEIGIARAERLPRIDLSALLTGQWIRAFGSTVHFDTWSAGPTVSAPILDAGLGGANVRGAEARYSGALATLLSTMRTTAQDMEDALVAQSSAEQRVGTSQQAVDAARVALSANEARYRAGAISLFELEDARRQFNSAQESSITAARDRARAWVALVRASGNAVALATAREQPVAHNTDATNPVTKDGIFR
jgi:outer membrane protein TolC